MPAAELDLPQGGADKADGREPAKLATLRRKRCIRSALARAFQHRRSNMPCSRPEERQKTANPGAPGQLQLDPAGIEHQADRLDAIASLKLSPRTGTRTLQIAIFGP